MPIPLVVNNVTFNYPVNFDEDWGVAATGWAQAVTSGMLQMSGGSFPLTNDVNFGASHGLTSAYFIARTSNPATAGSFRLSSADPGIAFRNNANSGNLIVTTDASDNLLFNGQIVALSGGGTGGNPSFTSVTVSNTGVILKDTEGSPKTVTVTVPATLTNTWTFKFPISSGGNGQVLSTDGFGNTSWINPSGGGTVNTGTANHMAYYATSSATISDSGIVNTNIFLADGSVTATADLNLNSHKLTNVTDPTSAQDAATKNYVDKLPINIQSGTLTTQASTGNSVFTNTGLTATITPKFSTSKVLVMVSGMGSHTGPAGSVIFTVTRNGANIATGTNGLAAINLASSGGSSPSSNEYVPVTLTFLDSPGTNASVAYNLQFKATAGPGTVYFNAAGFTASIVVQEIYQ